MQIRAYVRDIFAEAVDQGFLAKDPARKLRPPANLRATDKTVLTWDQLVAAVEKLDLRDRVLLRLDITNALRAAGGRTDREANPRSILGQFDPHIPGCYAEGPAFEAELNIGSRPFGRQSRTPPLRASPSCGYGCNDEASGDRHDGFVAGAIFRQFRDESVPVIVPPALNFCVPADGLPGCLEQGNVPRRVRGPGLTPGKDVPLVSDLAEPLEVPCTVIDERLVDLGVQRNDSPLSGLGFCSADLDCFRDEVDLAPGKSLDLGISQTSVAGQHEGRVHMGTVRALCFGCETLRFFGVVGFADLFVNGQLELLRLLEMSADHSAWVSQHLQKKPDLFIDRLWRGLLAEPVLLVAENRNFGDVGDYFRAEKTTDVSEHVSGKTRRTIAEPVAREVFVDDLLKNPNSVLSNLFEVVVASFERSPVLPLGLFRDRSRCRFCRLADAFSGEAKPVPPVFSSLISCHSGLLSFR